MYARIEMLSKAAGLLTALGYEASVEYPAYLHVALTDGRTASFGWANGPFGGDLMTDGRIEGLDVADATTAEEIAASVTAALDAIREEEK